MTILEGPRPEPMTPQERGKKSSDVISLFESDLIPNPRFNKPLAMSFFGKDTPGNITCNPDNGKLTSFKAFKQGAFKYDVSYEIEPYANGGPCSTIRLEVKKYDSKDSRNILASS